MPNLRVVTADEPTDEQVAAQAARDNYAMELARFSIAADRLDKMRAAVTVQTGRVSIAADKLGAAHTALEAALAAAECVYDVEAEAAL